MRADGGGAPLEDDEEPVAVRGDGVGHVQPDLAGHEDPTPIEDWRRLRRPHPPGEDVECPAASSLHATRKPSTLAVAAGRRSSAVEAAIASSLDGPVVGTKTAPMSRIPPAVVCSQTTRYPVAFAATAGVRESKLVPGMRDPVPTVVASTRAM
jgi:hypothetical protein